MMTPGDWRHIGCISDSSLDNTNIADMGCVQHTHTLLAVNMSISNDSNGP